MTRLRNIAIAFDQLAYVLVTLGAGSPDETLSAAAWRTEQDGKLWGRIMRPLLDLAFSPFEPLHCYQSYLSEVQSKHLPPQYRETK